MFIHVNGVRLFYEKQGTGKPLILLHGNEEDHRIFDEAIELLKKHYTVYAVDSRGHGQSDKVLEYHYLDMAKDIQEMIEQLDSLKTELYKRICDRGYMYNSYINERV